MNSHISERSGERLFIAIKFPEEIKEQLSNLSKKISSLKWTPTENIHLTLKFIGQTPPQKALAISEALIKVEANAFAMRLSTIGMFKSPRQTVLWAGMEKTAGLLNLKKQVDEILAETGLPEDKNFSPHITLSRLKPPTPAAVSKFIEDYGDFSTHEFLVENFVLYKSELLPGGPVYSVKKEYPLNHREQKE